MFPKHLLLYVLPTSERARQWQRHVIILDHACQTSTMLHAQNQRYRACDIIESAHGSFPAFRDTHVCPCLPFTTFLPNRKAANNPTTKLVKVGRWASQCASHWEIRVRSTTIEDVAVKVNFGYFIVRLHLRLYAPLLFWEDGSNKGGERKYLIGPGHKCHGLKNAT